MASNKYQQLDASGPSSAEQGWIGRNLEKGKWIDETDTTNVTSKSAKWLFGKEKVTNRLKYGYCDYVSSLVFGSFQLACTVFIYMNSAKNYAEDLGITNLMIVLLACSCYRFLVHVIGPFIREDVIMWNRFVSRMIFPNVATIVIWFMFLTPPTLLESTVVAINFVTGGNSTALTLPTHGTNFLIPNLDFALLTASMIV